MLSRQRATVEGFAGEKADPLAYGHERMLRQVRRILNPQYGLKTMSKNKLSDLNDHLFMQLERLGDESLTAEQLAVELERSKAISGIAKDVVSNARLVLDAQTRIADIPEKTQLPQMLT
jgi:hypothetical protein